MERPIPKTRVTGLIVVLAVFVIYLALTIVAGQFPDRYDILRAILDVFFTHNLRRISPKVTSLVLDLFLFGGSLVFWMAFLSQFILPLKKAGERYKAWNHLTVYSTKQHGLAVRIENGKIIFHGGEVSRKGPGVMILDTNSAALLGTATRLTRPVGPGVVFTDRGETLVDTVELRKKTRPKVALGPLPDENPFLTQLKDESDEAFKARQARRSQTAARTRDLIDVVPNLQVVFSLDGGPPGDGQPFSFNEKAVFRYLSHVGENLAYNHTPAGRGEGPPSAGGSPAAAPHIQLDDLPAYMAVDVFRGTISKFTLDELFQDLDHRGDPGAVRTAFQVIVDHVTDRLRQEFVERLDDIGRPTGERVPSPEFKLLQECGLQVRAVVVSRFRLMAPVEERLVGQWVSTWLQRAQLERDQVERQRALAVQRGKDQALRQYAAMTTRALHPDMLAMPVPALGRQRLDCLGEVLDVLLRGTWQGCITNSRLYPRLIGLDARMAEVIDLLRRARRV